MKKFNGEQFAIQGGTGRYNRFNIIKTPYGAVYAPGIAYEGYSVAQTKLGGEPHEHNRERCRRYRQQYGRDAIWAESCK